MAHLRDVRTVTLLLVAAGLLLSVDGSPLVAQASDGELAPSEVDELRALPYLAHSKKKAEPSGESVVVLREDLSYPGYTLYTIRNLCTIEMIDKRGRAVHSWQQEPCGTWSNFELLPNGDLLVAGSDPVKDGNWVEASYLLKLSWDGEVLWKSRITAHHDVEVTPDNRILTLTERHRHEPSFHPTINITDHLLTLLTTDGTVLEEISLYDLFSSKPGGFTLRAVKSRKRYGVEEIDLFHANSIEWMSRPYLQARHPIYGPDNVLVSMRSQDTIAVVSWENKEVIWSWGRGEISGQHDATVLDNGNILVFDNGLKRKASRVVEVNPITREIVWEYSAPNPRDFFTQARGSNQRLPNGNTLIANSDSGEAFEVTSDGEIVWHFLTPHLTKEGYRFTIVRARRYEVSFIGNILRQVREQ